ncbi:cysteine hydrolase family protein [Gordonia humi]|uniref:Nicotinamidase-related amidase n=1 Tax=Gordonia humi TaxID=686429 RepID=A0A840EZ94_9ACTN|nr:isochorismatase family cysteine hydrolase [Gordonia humi]MBB4134339.1 nicotinamidase-related amidase [Gordonia humi]
MTDYLDPHWPTAVLVIIDVQRDFVDSVPGTADVVPTIARLASSFRAAGRPIVHVVRSYAAGESDVDVVRRSAIEAGEAAVEPGTPGARIPDELLPAVVDLDWDLLRSGRVQRLGDVDHALYKPRWSAFYRTRLDALLRGADVDTVVVAGCNLPNCPRATLFDASERDYRTVLVTDATSQTTAERIADLELIGVRSATVDEVTGAIGRSASVSAVGGHTDVCRDDDAGRHQ